jgi:hypothetical protein
MGGMSSRDENAVAYKHAVEFLDSRVDNYMFGYEDDQRKRGYLAEAAFVHLTLGNHGTYEKLVGEVLRAHGLDTSLVEEVRIDYKIAIDGKSTVRITKGTALDELIKNDKIVFIFRILDWNPKSKVQKLDMAAPVAHSKSEIVQAAGPVSDAESLRKSQKTSKDGRPHSEKSNSQGSTSYHVNMLPKMTEPLLPLDPTPSYGED